jgi:Zn-dependent protease with chaperone function
MPSVDFDFQRYVERRKGAREAEAREGAAYAYAYDLRLLRGLDRLRPAKLALEATVRLWRSAARAELLAGATKATLKQEASVHAAGQRCAERLHVAAPDIYVTPAAPDIAAHTLGTADEAYVVLSSALVATLNENELVFAVGRQLGRIQNQHVLPATALYYLEHFASRYVRWIVAPALVALRGWARRSEITIDRAGLLCTRDLEIATAALGKLGASPARIAALRIFADSAYYRGVTGGSGGAPPDECDEEVSRVLKAGASSADKHDEDGGGGEGHDRDEGYDGDDGGDGGDDGDNE